jgi:glutamate dehydrogenase
MLDISSEEGLARRLAVPFKVKADVFVPAGGRPNTINIDNWTQYMDENGRWSTKRRIRDRFIQS